MTHSGLSASLALLLGATSVWAAPVPDCNSCAAKLKALAQQESNRNKNVELLGKNRGYLAVISADQASKILKVESNTFMILKKLDTIKAETKRLEAEYEKEGCLKCPTQP